MEKIKKINVKYALIKLYKNNKKINLQPDLSNRSANIKIKYKKI